MRIQYSAAAAAAALAIAAAGQAGATVTTWDYNNYTLANSGMHFGEDIATGTVADTFTAAGGDVVTQIEFVSQDFGGPAPTTVNWAIVIAPTNADPIGGSFTSVANGTATTFTNQATFPPGGLGELSLWDNTFAVDVTLPNLPSGDSYWLELSGAGSDFLINWDFSDGASLAYYGGGAQGSNTFDISGTVPASTPEPATWALMLAGFAGMGAALRSRRRREATA
jgi:hypothetical protein